MNHTRAQPRFTTALLAAAVVVSAVWFGLDRLQTRADRGAVGTRAEALDQVERKLDAWASLHRSQAEQWAADERIVSLVEELLSTERKRQTLLMNPAQRRLREILSVIVGTYGDPDKRYFGFLIVAPDGVQLASRGDRPVGHREFYNLDSALREGLQGNVVIGTPFASPRPLPASQGRIVARVATALTVAPVRSESGKVIAVLALRIDPSREYSRIFEEASFGETGRIVAVGSDGSVVSLNRFPPTPESHPVFALTSNFSDKAERQRLSYQGPWWGGLTASFRWNSVLNQGLVAEQQQREILASYYGFRDKVILFGVPLALVALLVGLGWGRTVASWRHLSLKRQPVAWTVLAISLAASVWVWREAQRDYLTRERLRLERSAERVERAVQERIRAYTDLVRTGRAFSTTAGHSGSKEWQRFIEALGPRRRFPGVLAVGSLPKRANPVVWPQPIGPSAIAARYLWNVSASLKDNENGDRRETTLEGRRVLSDARDSGFARLSPALDFAGFSPVVLLAVPVFDPEAVTGSTAERRTALQGWTAAVIEISEMLEDVIDPDRQDLGISVADFSLAGPPRTIYGAAAGDAGQDISRQIEFAGRSWTLRFHKESEPIGLATLTEPEQKLFFGVVCGFLMFGLISSLGATKERAQSLAETMTARLRDSEARNRAIVEYAGEGIIMIGLTGRIETFNAAAREIFQYGPNEAVAVPLTDLVEVRARSELAAFLGRPEVVQTRKPLLLNEARGLRKDGSSFPMEMTIGEMQLGGGTVFVAIVRDITEREHAQKERQRLERNLQHSQKLKSLGVLAGGIAHDFNNILTAILGYGLLVCEALPAGSDERSNQEQVIKAAERAAELVRRLLTYGRQKEREQRAIDMAKAVGESLDMLRASITSIVKFETHIERDCGHVLADSGQIQQVVVNLCTNAYQAMAETGGTLTVTLHCVDVDSETARDFGIPGEGRYNQLIVSDTGPGIDPAIRDQIFDPFFTTKNVGEGTGLGLALVYGIVTRAGGSIDVQTEAGKGARFIVYLPTIEAPPSDPQPLREDVGGQGGQEHLLFVDDEEAIVSLGKQMLERLGYKVTGCTSSLEALATLSAEPDRFDLVVTDLTMPELTGHELAAELRKLRPKTPVILMSGFTGETTQEDLIASGVNDTISKPFTAEKLGRKIRQRLDQSG